MNGETQNQQPFEVPPAAEFLGKHTLRPLLVSALAVFALQYGETETVADGQSIQHQSPAATQKHHAKHAHHSPPAACTTIRRRPQEIITGTACADIAKGARVDANHAIKGWIYNAISVQGIYKCGWVREGVLPRFKPRSGSVSKCRAYRKPLENQRNYVLKDINCPELLPGLEGCRGGAPSGPIPKACNDHHEYRNYATDEPSPLNVYGTGNGGFSLRIRGLQKAVSYRATIIQGSKDGKAAVVRGSEWGFVPENCVGEPHKRGGPVTKLTPQQKQRIFADPRGRQTLKQLTK